MGSNLVVKEDKLAAADNLFERKDLVAQFFTYPLLLGM